MNVLMWCHGGCFSGGSVDYDKEFRHYLFDYQICVVLPVDFSMTDWDRAIQDIVNRTLLIKANDGAKLIIGGISSGALLAHEVANRLNLPAVLVCPVIKPFTRHASLSEDLQFKQLQFFKTISHMKEIEESIMPPNNSRYILYGSTDQRAPVGHFKDWLGMDNVAHDALNQGHELCNNIPCELVAKRIMEMFS